MSNKQEEICQKENYQPYLDYGFVGFLEHMGSDETIEFSARMSYGDGTRTVNDRRNLIRYLVRHQHTSPIEQGEVRFHIKMPIAVARQFVRHRTASCNELSQRYSKAPEEIYIPDLDRIQEQSETNKQCSGELLPYQTRQGARNQFIDAAFESMAAYNSLLEEGVSRELARGVLSVHGYTEIVWKIDLRNFLHFTRLRWHKHAQLEIREMARIMYEMVKPLFPLTCEAFEDYQMNSRTLSRMELEALQSILKAHGVTYDELETALKTHNVSKRELNEFRAILD